MKPLVSVVIPMFNAAATIGRALESLQSQTLAQWGAIVVDDGSTDGSGDIVRGMAQEDARITLVHQPNAGPGAARNLGISRADGWFLHFLDADDWLESGGLRALVDRASDGGAAFGRSRLVGPNGASIGRTSVLPRDEVGLDDLLEENPIQTSVAMVRRDVLGESRFCEHLRFALDYDLWLKLALRGVVFRATPEVVAAYRLRPDGQSRNAAEQLRAIDGFLMEAYASAREGRATKGRGGVAVDATEARRGRVMARLALRRGTALAVAGRGSEAGTARALELAAPYLAGRTIVPEDAGGAAFEAVLHTTCAMPDVQSAEAPGWVGGLDRFWSVCVERGWAGEGLVEGARAEMALRMVDPDAIASALLTRASAMGKVLTVIGLGSNGRLLAEHALERGMRVLGRDDAYEPGDVRGPRGVAIEAADGPLSREGAVVVTPLVDEVLAARYAPEAPGARLMRWSTERNAMARDLLAALEQRWLSAQPARRVA